MYIKRYNKYIKEELDGLDDKMNSLAKEFKEFWWLDRDKLIEASKPIIEMLKKDCSKFIEDIKGSGSLLYRGTHKMVGEFDAFDVRKNRKPSSTHKDLSKMVDDSLFDKFGVRPRSEGVFSTSDEGSARNYGQIFLFFPIGDYEYIWSDQIEDLYVDITNFSDFDMYKDTFTNTDLKSGIESGNEIVFICDKYYLIKTRYEMEIIKELFK